MASEPEEEGLSLLKKLWGITGDTEQMKPYLNAIGLLLECRTFHKTGKHSHRYDMHLPELPSIKGDCSFGHRMDYEKGQPVLWVTITIMKRRPPEEKVVDHVSRLIPVEQINREWLKPVLDWLDVERRWEKEMMARKDSLEDKILDILGCQCAGRPPYSDSTLKLCWPKFQGTLTTHRIDWFNRFRFHIYLHDDRWKDPVVEMTVEQDEISAEKLKPVLDWIDKRRVA